LYCERHDKQARFLRVLHEKETTDEHECEKSEQACHHYTLSLITCGMKEKLRRKAMPRKSHATESSANCHRDDGQAQPSFHSKPPQCAATPIAAQRSRSIRISNQFTWETQAQKGFGGSLA